MGGLILLYLVNPEQSALMPKCPFHALTGLECPACGTQRALHQLLHLHPKEALQYNPFLLVSFPYVALFIWTEWFDPTKKFPRLYAFCHHPYVLYLYAELILLWWIGRNLMHSF